MAEVEKLHRPQSAWHQSLCQQVAAVGPPAQPLLRRSLKSPTGLLEEPVPALCSQDAEEDRRWPFLQEKGNEWGLDGMEGMVFVHAFVVSG